MHLYFLCQYPTQANSFKSQVTKLEYVKSKVMKSLAEERHERIHHEREIASLKHRLENLERDKKFLMHDVCIKEDEKSRITEREGKLLQNKQELIKSLTELDQERRVQANTNFVMNDTIGALMNIGKSQEMQLLTQRKEIDSIVENMKQKRKEHEEILRQLGMKDKTVQMAQDHVKHSAEKMDHLERQARHWKEEFLIKETDKRETDLGWSDTTSSISLGWGTILRIGILDVIGKLD
jgi:chromosome segregation ATPase